MSVGIYTSNYQLVPLLIESIESARVIDSVYDIREYLLPDVDTTTREMHPTITISEVARERGERGAYDIVTVYFNFWASANFFVHERDRIMRDLARLFGYVTSPSQLPSAIVRVGTASPFSMVREVGRPVAHFLATVQYRVANCVSRVA